MTKTVPERARITHHIGRRVTQSIFRAFDFTNACGRPFNLYVVINLTESGGAGAATQFAAIRHKYRDWLAYHRRKGNTDAAPLYAFTFENPDGHQHVNWTLHVPPNLQADFRHKLVQWVRRACAAHGPFDVHCQPVTRHHKSLAKYIVKGTDPAYVSHFHLGELHKPQGVFVGKRAGACPALGRAARHAAGYDPKRRALV